MIKVLSVCPYVRLLFLTFFEYIISFNFTDLVGKTQEPFFRIFTAAFDRLFKVGLVNDYPAGLKMAQ